ncbi:glycosyltransferase family A protein [Pontibacter chitinilyticus]|uniref:glycosyltransferase family A protein n=1 Tax=Pontibacter chitinilyticus TaxID=2674989 RepID=UPI00321B5D2A
MLAFVVPLRPKLGCKNWELEVHLLKRTIKSILNQTSSNFQIFLVYTDKPELNIDDPKLRLIKFPYQFLPLEEIIDKNNPHNNIASKSNWGLVSEMDKGRKVSYGCKIAKENRCDYIMQVDGDDLVNRSIAEFVNSHLHLKKPGWYIEKGYIYVEGRKYILKQPSKMNLINSSTHILREDLVSIPDFNSKDVFDFSLFGSHGYLKKRIFLKHKVNITAFPYYGIIYILSGNNQSAIFEINKAKSLKNFIKLLVRGKLLSSKLRMDFGLYNINL